MADITLRDLLHWERTLVFRAPSGQPHDAGLDKPVSWAVMMRAALPILPALRGGEIVIAPPRVLEQLRATEMVTRDQLSRMLAGQPIAALMVDPSFNEDAVAGVPLLVTRGTFPLEAESVLNRLITERRAELYRLGSELSRALSMATMIGAGLDTLLDAAETAGGRPLALQSSEGSLVAASRGTDPEQVISARECLRLVDARDNGQPLVIEGRARSWPWLARVIGDGEQRRRGARGAILSIACVPNASTEMERLILEQTGEAVSFVLRQATDGVPNVRDRLNRESLVADLLLGRLLSREALDARSRLLGLDPVATTRVALFASRVPDLGGRVRSALAEVRGRAFAAVAEGEYAVILTSGAHAATDTSDLMAAHRALSASDPTFVLALSETVDGTAGARAALEQARVLSRLARNGAVDGSMLHAGDADQVGFYSLFIRLANGTESDHAGQRERFDSFATTLLGALEEHDRARGSELVATLDAYLRLGGALAQAADALGIHRNTLSYRLGRIAELSGRELNDPRARFLLQVALNARALERAITR
ncbi:MAG TPA: helix-turn-helix domain-containing protein [Thermomicrobiales bacterium]|nr:helix-turn-helix domain-containing protein [Thermomicrobiales bacterium]